LSLGATRVYVATTGNDGTGDGTSGNPYLTIATGISHASAGDTVFIVAGTYNVSTQIVLPVQVSLMGEGETSNIILTYTSVSSSSGCIQLASNPTEGTNGNQSISYLRLDGDLTGTNAIVVYCRSNVKVHNCTIIDFAQSGVTFRGNNVTGEAIIKATDNQVYNCNILNSSTRGAVSDGLIRISSQTNMSIHDNILNQTGKPIGSNGNILDAVGGYNSNISYYNNKSYKPYSEGTTWNFHIESWDGRGGWHVYNNEFHGGGCHIDIAGNSNIKGAYNYSWWVHDNIFKQDVLQAYNVDGYFTIGVDLERNVQDAIIERNRFERLNWGIYITTDTDDGPNRNHIRYNIFKEIGTTDNVFAAGIMISTVDVGNNLDSTFIDNNTFTAGDSFNVGAALITGVWSGTVDETYFRNNIIEGFYRGSIWVSTGDGQVGSLKFYNNLRFNTANAIYYSSGETITSIDSLNNKVANPFFKSNETFRLRPTSPAIDAGIDVGLTTDYWGHRIPQGSAPDIGAAEYGNYVLFYNGKQLH